MDNPQGVALTKLRGQDDPDTEDDDDELSVYGVNAGKNEIIYNTSLLNIEIYRGEPGTPESLQNPRGIACNASGDVYVADKDNGRIAHLFNEEGKNLVYRSDSRPNAENFRPFDVTLASGGDLFVSDSAGSKIWTWDSSTHHWKVLIDSIDTPLGIVSYDRNDEWTRYKQSRLGIICENGKKVVITDFEGRKLSGYKPEEKNAALRYIATDYYNNYYLTDAANGRIIKIDRHGKLIDTIGSEGKGDYQFQHPQGIAVWKRFGQVCVAESYAAQYYLIGTDILATDLSRNGETLRLSFELTERADVTITVMQPGKSEVDTLVDDRRVPQGGFTHRWEIPENAREGEYVFRISAVPSYSSTKFFRANRVIRRDFKHN
ncbi:MAG: hypothetical protein K9N46_05905 [Candidatus Marinimicrobia bacterium]|nr:hypothetical protein [Candidatus Neomarinimicrobiota bacterium]MCF7880255.1 hypothetical protein [Candidatus Neomarinimicrobiota bacterium]